VYARWWSLETWLRELVHLELRAAFGTEWLAQLANTALSRAAADEINRYMASPDSVNALAYLDVADLFALIDNDDRWYLFEPVLIPRARWRGTVDELQTIRRRSAHCRRPHDDDLTRLEQILRDLEPGARRALVAYHEREQPPANLDDPIVEAWIRNEHEVADRLTEHARENYDTTLRISYSKRPWANAPELGPITGTPGLLWHARFLMRHGRYLSPRRFWDDHYLDNPGVRELIIHSDHHSPAEAVITFAAVDDPQHVCDAIGWCFESIVTLSQADASRHQWEHWAEPAAQLDPRVHTLSPFAQYEGHGDLDIFLA